MIDTIDTIKPALPKPSAVRRANRALLVMLLFGGTIFSIFFTPLGMSENVAFCLDAVVVIAVLQYLLRGTPDSPLELLKRYREVNIPLAVAVTILLLIVSEGVLTFASAFTPRLYLYSETLNQSMANSAWEMGALILVSVVLVPFYEELIFRGLALRAYAEARSPLFAVLFTGVLFGFIHGSLLYALAISLAGIVLALVMLKTGQLWTLIAVHAFSNLIATLLVEFDVPTLPAIPAFGLLGLVVAALTFWLLVRWAGAPRAILSRVSTDRKSIWTVSLVVVVLIAVAVNLLTTYEALWSSVGAVR